MSPLRYLQDGVGIEGFPAVEALLKVGFDTAAFSAGDYTGVPSGFVSFMGMAFACSTVPFELDASFRMHSLVKEDDHLHGFTPLRGTTSDRCASFLLLYQTVVSVDTCEDST